MDTPDRTLLVVSEGAGSAQQEAVERARAVLAAAGDVELRTTGTPEDLDRALDDAGDRRVVLAGGDGSVHLAVQRLRDRGELSRPLALVPLGTGNDLARSAGLSLDPERAARTALDGRPSPVDLLVDDAGGVVVNAVHVGVGAEAAQRSGRLKPLVGLLAYPLGALAAGLRAPGWHLRVEVDGVLVGERRTLMVGVGNGRTIGGGTPLLPRAEVDDGLLDVVVAHAVGPLARVRYGAALRTGEHLADREVRSARGRSVTVSGEPVDVNADGELGDTVTRRTWTVEPGAWSLVR